MLAVENLLSMLVNTNALPSILFQTLALNTVLLMGQHSLWAVAGVSADKSLCRKTIAHMSC